jgi:hypothetical protein
MKIVPTPSRPSPPGAFSIATSPAIARMSVDLPEPDAPINATISPGRTEKLTSSSTRVPRSNDFETRRTSIRGCVGKR